MSALRDNSLLYGAGLLVETLTKTAPTSVAPRRHWCPLIKSGYFAAIVLPLFSFLYSRAIEFAVTSFDKRSVARIPDNVVGKLITKSCWPNDNQHK